ncbi:DUF317 domain-containing protein [Kitasatospora aureofaciens]|uniref:DUF317 domain-containing protein n=1 Tax=Kitasatospora aureofaciens TaxID=1894 RepID=UPI00210C7D45|nr:DUF317 domain-containing protein [Kitasatospora aureofaciens]
MAFQSPDATAGLIRWDAGAYYDEPHGQNHPAEVTLWARCPDDFPRKAWSAHFLGNTPTRLITAGLDHLTDPQPQVRRLAEVPFAHRDLVEIRPYTGSTRPLAATERTTLADIPVARWNAAAAAATQAAAARAAGRKT